MFEQGLPRLSAMACECCRLIEHDPLDLASRLQFKKAADLQDIPHHARYTVLIESLNSFGVVCAAAQFQR